MALNNIQLNSALVKEMYKSLLVEPDEGIAHKNLPELSDEPIGKTHLVKEWKYLGGLKKNILLIVRYPDTAGLPDEQLNFLTSILAACKLNLGDAAILNISHSPSASYKDVMEKFKSTKVILFGVTPEEFEMPINFPEFQVQRFNNCTFLYGPVLEKLEADKILKSKLWVCLRKTFDLA